MEIVRIDNTIRNKSNKQIKEQLNLLSFKFCSISDHTDPDAEKDLIIQLESYILVSLIRIVKNQLGFEPRQNKMFERVEAVFGVDSQEAYNINRALSSLRRAKMFGIDTTDVKYIEWFENRVFYTIKTLMDSLETITVKVAETHG